MKYLNIISIAIGEAGNAEKPPYSNKTKYGKWFGLDGLPWCGQFVSWVYAKAGFPLGNIGFLKGFAGCQTAVAHFRKSLEVTDSPMPGDIVFFDWNKDGRFDHTGIVVSVHDQYFETVEGNTSLANDSNGGSVMIRKRKYRNVLFVHPKVVDLSL